MGDGASDIFATLGHLTALTTESAQGNINLRSDLDETLEIFGCVLNYPNTQESEVATLAGVPEEKVREVFKKAREAYLKKGMRI